MSFTDSKTIEPSGVEPAPFTYQLSSAEAIAVQSMSVTFDGSLAAGNFLACADFLAPDGTLIARCPADASVNVGDVAEVTFAPFLRTASSGGGGLTTSTEQLQQSAVATPVANHTTHIIPATSHLAGPTFANFGGSANTFAVAGLFAISANIQMATTPWTAGGAFQATIAVSSYNITATELLTFPTVAGAPFPTANEVNVQLPPLFYAIGDQFFLIVENLDGALSLNFQVQTCSVIGYS